MTNFSQSLDEVMDHEARAVAALEQIAHALTTIGIVMSNRYQKEFPVKVSSDATITKIPTEEDKLRESLGSSDEPIEEWIGLREQDVIQKKK